MFDPVLFAALMSSTAAFTPLSLFAAGEQGAWYDPSDFSTMFQDAAGTTPVTAVEQPVGLLLDKSKGLALGSELVTNGDFSSNTWWSTGGGAAISGGALNFTAAVATSGAFRLGFATVGKYYELTFEIVSISSGGVQISLGTSVGTNRTAAGVYTQRILCTGNTNLTLYSVGASTTASVDNVSIKEVQGNHASQSTAASRPVLSARVNLLTYSEQFDNAAWSPRTSDTVTPNATTAPDGALTADKWVLSATTSAHDWEQLVTTVATNYTLSISVKAAEYTAFQIAFASGISTQYANFDLSNGTVSAGSYSAASCVSQGNNWHRCSITFTAAATTNVVALLPITSPTAGRLPSFLGAAGSGIFVWGADLRVTNVGVGLPAYQRVAAATDYDTSGFPLYLLSDGVDDQLNGPALSNFISASEYEACLGARVTSVGSNNVNPWSNQALFGEVSGYLSIGFVKTTNVVGAFNWDGAADEVTLAMTPPSTFVIQQRHNGGNLTLSLNGGSEASVASGNTTLLTPSTKLLSGAGNNSISGRLYGAIIRSTAFTASERASALAWMNNLTKAY